ncbi:hypothetical protein ACNKHO_25240 [Shigella flexneri]
MTNTGHVRHPPGDHGVPETTPFAGRAHDCYGGSYRLFDSLAKRGYYLRAVC